MMLARFLLFGCLSLFLASSIRADDEPVYSGPQAGESVTPFSVLQFSGENANQEVELLEENGKGPTMLIFVHQLTRPLMQLLRPVDAFASELQEQRLETHFIWLTGDRTETSNFLNRARGSLQLRSPIGISLDGIDGPGNYGLNRNVTVTILLADDGKVKHNFAIVQPNETDAPKVLQAMAELVNTEAPSPEEIQRQYGRRAQMRREMKSVDAAEPGERTAQFERIEQELSRLRAQQENMQRRLSAQQKTLEEQLQRIVDVLNETRTLVAKLEGQPAPGPLRIRLSGKPSQDPELQALMRQMIQGDNDQGEINRIAEELTLWTGNDQVRQEELADFCQMIIGLGYGTDAAQAKLNEIVSKVDSGGVESATE